MFDDGDGQGLGDFDDVAGRLFDQGAATSPAEVHGCLSGLLAGGGSTQAEYGLHAMSLALDVSPHGELAALVMDLYTTTASALTDDETVFQLLLPGEHRDIADRAVALAAWCTGFLAGIAEAGATASTGRQWSVQGMEILEDIAALARAGAGEHETPEEAEESYLELVDYLCLAVQNLALERGPATTDDAAHPAATVH